MAQHPPEGDQEGGAASAPQAQRAGRRRHPVRWVVAAVVVVVVMFAVVDAVLLVRADHRLRAGIAAATAARRGASIGAITGGSLLPEVRAATRELRAAHAEVTSGWLAPLRVLPVARTQLRSVTDLSGAAEQVTAAVGTTLSTAGPLLAAPHSTPAQRTAVVRALARDIGRLQTAVRRVDPGPDRNLVGPLATKRKVFVADLAKLRSELGRAEGATSALAALLTGPDTYLVAATNNAEMRAGTGTMLDLGTLRVDDGRFTLSHFLPASQLVGTARGVRPSGDLAARWGFERPATDYRELLLSPQFPAGAALAARMWRAGTGQRVDGVLAVDVGAVDDLLGATGPVRVGSTTYTQADAVGQLLIGQYAGLAVSSNQAARHEKLGRLAATVLAAVEGGHTPLGGLAHSVTAAVAGRHLLAWAADPAIEADWAAAGAAGTVGGDGLLLSVINEGADKLDPYLRVSSHASVRTGGGRSTVTVRDVVANATPASVTGYAAGGSKAPPRHYQGIVSLDFPWAAGYATASGGPVVVAGRDYGARVLAVGVSVPPGGERTVTFRFTVDGTAGALHVEPSARIPPTAWTWQVPGRPAQRFSDGAATTVRW